MTWFRSNRRWESWCAIIALTIQLLCSFGHAHIEGAVSAPSLAVALSEIPSDSAGGHPDQPVPGKPFGLNDFCVTCANFHWVGLVPGTAPLPWSVPIMAGQLTAGRQKSTAPELMDRRFQARAPPVV